MTVIEGTNVGRGGLTSALIGPKMAEIWPWGTNVGKNNSNRGGLTSAGGD